MLFQTFEFFCFFVIFFGLYCVFNHRNQNRLLLLAGLVFYGSWDWHFLFLLGFTTIFDFQIARLMQASADKVYRKRLLIFSVSTNLSVLFFFKYYDFFAVNVGAAFSALGMPVSPPLLHLILPLGISFYTFHNIGYVVDVYSRRVQAEPDLVRFGTFIAYFPQLIAGPIERSRTLLPQIQRPRTITADGLWNGLRYFLLGLFAKVYVADNLHGFVDRVFVVGGTPDGPTVAMGVFLFAFQIYGDFCGYTFMAYGLASAMGIRLSENFRRPYLSSDIGEFWRRWHVSLSSWFRDYVFLPLTMWCNKKLVPVVEDQKRRELWAFGAALLITEVLLGLWHGAAWTFLLFGIWHGIAIFLHHIWSKEWSKLPRVLRVATTFVIVCVGWLFFRATSLEQAWQMIWSVSTDFLTYPSGGLREFIRTVIFYCCPLIAINLIQERQNDDLAIFRGDWRDFFSIVGLSSLIVLGGEFNAVPFIYFAF